MASQRSLLRFLVLLVLLLPGISRAQQSTARRNTSTERTVEINGTVLLEAHVRALEIRYRTRILPGRYWYDHASGAWGWMGGPTVGFVPAHLALPGPMPADASHGATGVFINGRELPVEDVRALQQIVGVVLPGRYWADAYGNVGVEGGPAFLNLAVMARQSGVGRSNAFYRSSNTGIGAGSSGGTSYVMGKDWSVIVE